MHKTFLTDFISTVFKYIFLFVYSTQVHFLIVVRSRKKNFRFINIVDIRGGKLDINIEILGDLF